MTSISSRMSGLSVCQACHASKICIRIENGPGYLRRLFKTPLFMITKPFRIPPCACRHVNPQALFINPLLSDSYVCLSKCPCFFVFVYVGVLNVFVYLLMMLMFYFLRPFQKTSQPFLSNIFAFNIFVDDFVFVCI